jgi:non-specific serine/threonine protein kinase
VVEALTGLIEKSVVIAEETSAGLRYRMLDTIREYGLDRIREPSDQCPEVENEAGVTRRHFDFYVGLAERFDADWFSPRQVEWSQRLHAELPNLRAALDFCLTSPDGAVEGLRLAGALQYFWWGGGEAREGRLWLERILAVEAAPSAARIRALTAEGRLLTAQGLNGAAVQLMRPCVELARQSDGTPLLPNAVMVLGLCLLASGELAEALPLLDEAVELAALEASAEAVAVAKLYQAIGFLFSGAPVMAEALLAECQEICTSNGDKLVLGYALVNFGMAAWMRECPAEAGAYARESLPIQHTLHDRLGLCMTLELLAWTAAAARDFRRAARLLGILQRQSSALGGSPFQVEPFLSAHRDCDVASRGAIGDTSFAAEHRRGEELPLGDAVAYALADDLTDTETANANHPSTSATEAVALTRRQRQVVELVVQGLSNKEIARQLLIAVRTADSHVQSILLKLGFNSRAQIAAWHAEPRGRAE